MIISTFTPHGGCPERCSFCDQRVSGGEPVSLRKIEATIDEHLNSRRDETQPAELAFYGGTFTAFSQELQLKYLSAAKPYLDSGQISGVRVSTRPDTIDASWLQRLRDEFQLRTVELGVQSFDPEVLRKLGRTHSVESVESAREALGRLGLKTSFHLMVGCPEEKPDADQETLRWLEKLKPEMARFHPLLVLRGTKIEKDWQEKTFSPITLEDAITRLSALVEETERLGVRVIRIGLQPNELLGEAVLAGAYHPSLGELVRARIVACDLLRSNTTISQIQNLSDTLKNTLNPASWNLLLSHNRKALHWLENQFKSVL